MTWGQTDRHSDNDIANALSIRLHGPHFACPHPQMTCACSTKQLPSNGILTLCIGHGTFDRPALQRHLSSFWRGLVTTRARPNVNDRPNTPYTAGSETVVLLSEMTRGGPHSCERVVYYRPGQLGCHLLLTYIHDRQGAWFNVSAFGW